VGTAAATENGLAILGDVDGGFGKVCFKAMVTELTDEDKGMVAELGKDVCASGFDWDVGQFEEGCVGSLDAVSIG